MFWLRVRQAVRMTFSVRSLVAISLLGSGAGLALADKPKWTPPQAAFDACAKSKQGDACTFTGRGDRTLKGTCEVPRDNTGSGAALVCRPARGSGRHGGGSGGGGGSGTGSATH